MKRIAFVMCVVVALSAVYAWGESAPPPNPPPPDIRGVYVVVLDNLFSSSAGVAAQSALKQPGVDGMAFVVHWNTVEPSRGQYDWRVLDRWIGYADSLGKKITLVIKAGNGTPSWLFDLPPAGGGAAPLHFRVSPHDGKTGVCDTETIAAPWDPGFLVQWDSMLVTVSAHLKNKGTYSAVTALRLTGVNRTSDELRLPAESAQSTGLLCVSNADSTWQQAGYRPSLLLQAWDAITNSFQKSFPEKSFSIAIITNPPQVPFPAIGEDGTLITGTLPDQNQPLLALAAAKFPGRLVVQFNFLLPGTPANPFVIQAAQTLGTMVAFQTNNYFSLSDSGAACGGTPAQPVPCSSAPYLQMLETGIYPLGQAYSLRAQYIELWSINANAFPADLLQAQLDLRAPAPPLQTTLNLGTPKPLFHTGQLDMTYVPDMHLGVVQQPDNSYRVFISGIIGTGGNGSTGLLTTSDFLTYKPGVGIATKAQPVLVPSCDSSVSCLNNFDAGYAGANTVFAATNGTDLLMVYHGETRTFGSTTTTHTPMYAEVGLARSTDNGVTWTREGAIIAGTDPKPAKVPKSDVNGVPEPCTITSGAYLYTFYPYFPSAGDSDAGPSTIQVARALVSGDGMPGTWTKYNNGSFGTEPGLGGRGSQVVPAVGGSTGARQPWVAYSTYLHAYVLLFVTRVGWFLSTSSDLITWTLPTQFYTPADSLFTRGKQNDDNLILVTPGNPGQVIGQSGYVLYASTPSFGFGGGSDTLSVPHELWIRPFAFDALPTDVGATAASIPLTYALGQNYPNPFNPATTIHYDLPRAASVRLTVFSVLGQRVALLVAGEQKAGHHEVKFDAGGMASGVYLYRLEAGDFVETKKMLLVK